LSETELPLAYLLIKEVISTYSKHRRKKIEKLTNKLSSAWITYRLTWPRKQGSIRLAGLKKEWARSQVFGYEVVAGSSRSGAQSVQRRVSRAAAREGSPELHGRRS